MVIFILFDFFLDVKLAARMTVVLLMMMGGMVIGFRLPLGFVRWVVDWLCLRVDDGDDDGG